MLATVGLSFRIFFAALALAVVRWTFRGGGLSRASVQRRLEMRYDRSVDGRTARFWQVFSVVCLVVVLLFLVVYLTAGYGG